MALIFSGQPVNDESPVYDKVKAAELRQQFLALRSPADLAALLGIKNLQKQLAALNQYRTFTISKKSGGTRTISAPKRGLKGTQRKLAEILNCVYVVRTSIGGRTIYDLDGNAPRRPAHGFVPGKSILTNAKRHCGKRWVFNLDLENFFPSINFGRVRGLFMGPPFKLPDSVATTLARLCCYQNALPQGAPTSPIISNLICARLDGQLQRLARDSRCTYTRYADDITFSTNLTSFPLEILANDPGAGGGNGEPGDVLRVIIEGNGFKINLGKCRVQGKRYRQEVTGLTVNTSRPNVPRTFVSCTRAMLHAWKILGPEEAAAKHFQKKDDASKTIAETRSPEEMSQEFKRIVRGRIAYLGMIRTQDSCEPPSFQGDNPFIKLFAQQLKEYKILTGQIQADEGEDHFHGPEPWDYSYVNDSGTRRLLETLCRKMLRRQEGGRRHAVEFCSAAYKQLEVMHNFKLKLISTDAQQALKHAFYDRWKKGDPNGNYIDTGDGLKGTRWPIHVSMAAIYGWENEKMGGSKILMTRSLLNRLKALKNFESHPTVDIEKSIQEDKNISKKEIPRRLKWLTDFDKPAHVREILLVLKRHLREFHDAELPTPATLV